MPTTVTVLCELTNEGLWICSPMLSPADIVNIEEIDGNGFAVLAVISILFCCEVWFGVGMCNVGFTDVEI